MTFTLLDITIHLIEGVLITWAGLAVLYYGVFKPIRSVYFDKQPRNDGGDITC